MPREREAASISTEAGDTVQEGKGESKGMRPRDGMDYC